MSDNHNPEQGVERVPVLTMTVTFNTRTALVEYKCSDMPIALAQMIVSEVLRQLEEQRRLVAAVELRNNLAKQAADQALFDRLRKQ